MIGHKLVLLCELSESFSLALNGAPEKLASDLYLHGSETARTKQETGVLI